MIKVRIIKIMAILAILASLFGCGKNTPFEPQILDGPGMEYVDSEYRNDYANCLPFDDIQGEPYLAVAYLGKGEIGKENKDVCIDKLFKSLDAEKTDSIKTYEYEGDDWFLVVPKYNDDVTIKKGEEELRTEYGKAFVIKCNPEVKLHIFNVTDMSFSLEIDENENLKGTQSNVWKTEDCTTWGPDNFVWDITHLISENDTNNK